MGLYGPSENFKNNNCCNGSSCIEDFGVRKVAVRTLGELRAIEKIDEIAGCLEDEDGGVRSNAIFALGDLATEESIKIIKDARRKEKDKDFKKYCNKDLFKLCNMGMAAYQNIHSKF